MMRSLAILVLSGALCACGFSLRGTAQLPAAMETTQVLIGSDHRDLRDETRRLLRANDVAISDDAEAAGAILDLRSARLEREIQSVGETARVREFALVYRVDASLLDAKTGKKLWTSQLSLRRDYTYDQQQLVGLAQEEEVLERDLAREMAALILSDLSAADLQ